MLSLLRDLLTSLGKNLWYLLNDFSDNRALMRATGIFFLFNTCIRFGQISVSIKMQISGLIAPRKDSIIEPASKGKK